MVLQERAEEGRGSRERARGLRGSAWHSGLAPEAAEAGGGSGACPRAVATRLASFWREVGDGGSSGGLGQVSGPPGRFGAR